MRCGGAYYCECGSGSDNRWKHCMCGRIAGAGKYCDRGRLEQHERYRGDHKQRRRCDGQCGRHYNNLLYFRNRVCIYCSCYGEPDAWADYRCRQRMRRIFYGANEHPARWHLDDWQRGDSNCECRNGCGDRSNCRDGQYNLRIRHGVSCICFSNGERGSLNSNGTGPGVRGFGHHAY